MTFGALWKNREGDGFNGRFTPDVDLTLRQGVAYSIFLNKVDNSENKNLPDFRIELKVADSKH